MTAFTWYGNQSDAEACRFGSLAVIFPLIERMNVISIINQHCPADPQAEYDYGTTLSLLMAARLYSPLALSNVAEWARQTGADILWNIPPEKLNDDRLGRALETFFGQRHSILAHLALHAAREFNAPLQEMHYDPTHLLFTGAYEDAQAREGVIERNSPEQADQPQAQGQPRQTQPPQETIRSDEELAAAHITKGRATDDAPKGSMMVHAGVCTMVDEFGPLPFFGHTVDGNQNGRTAVDEQLALLRKHLKLNQITMFSDRGTFSVGHLLRLKDIGSYAVCSAPWGQFQELFEKHRKKLTWKTASYLSMEQQRRRDTSSELPQEHYELAVLRHTLRDDESGRTIQGRVIFVFSTADQKVVRQQRQKQIDRLREGLEKTQRNIARGGPYSDEPSVAKRMSRLLDGKDAARYFTWQLIPLTKGELKQLPKPGRGCHQPTHRFEFTFDAKAVKQAEKDDGYSAIVTTVPQRQSSADTVFAKFKQQTFSEQANRNFKGPLAVRPVFLHTPERVEALVFLMLAVLMLYYLLQRMYRQSVPANASQKERRTTTATILKAFSSYCLLIHRTRLGREIQPTRLTTRQREILQQLGFSTPAQILSQRLPRPPT
jgi:transposase